MAIEKVKYFYVLPNKTDLFVPQWQIFLNNICKFCDDTNDKQNGITSRWKINKEEGSLGNKDKRLAR